MGITLNFSVGIIAKKSYVVINLFFTDHSVPYFLFILRRQFSATEKAIKSLLFVKFFCQLCSLFFKIMITSRVHFNTPTCKPIWVSFIYVTVYMYMYATFQNIMPV